MIKPDLLVLTISVIKLYTEVPISAYDRSGETRKY